jgi:ABC-type uncharacterized transport system permease subunit
LFGFGEALKPYLPKVVPSQFIDMIPYVLTIFVRPAPSAAPPLRLPSVSPASKNKNGPDSRAIRGGFGKDFF